MMYIKEWRSDWTWSEFYLCDRWYFRNVPHPVSFDAHVTLETWETILTLQQEKNKLLHIIIVCFFFDTVFLGISLKTLKLNIFSFQLGNLLILLIFCICWASVKYSAHLCPSVDHRTGAAICWLDSGTTYAKNLCLMMSCAAFTYVLCLAPAQTDFRNLGFWIYWYNNLIH